MRKKSKDAYHRRQIPSGLEGAPVCRLAPTPDNFLWHTWWHFSTQFFTQFLAVTGLTAIETSTHQQYHRGRAHTLFSVVGHKE
jgi:hypothetical protein